MPLRKLVKQPSTCGAAQCQRGNLSPLKQTDRVAPSGGVPGQAQQMVENTNIEWTDHTFNPWVGCTKVSPACDHCYAESWAKRAGTPELWQGHRRQTKTWGDPIKWNRRAGENGIRERVFCASLADVFDNQVPELWRNDLWNLIDRTTNLDWLLLTKRPQNIERMLPNGWGVGWPNVWLGTTVENQQEAARRIPYLLDVPARIRFLSCEPLLEPLDLSTIDISNDTEIAPLGWRWLDRLNKGEPEAARIDWIIAGGESGPGSRPMHPGWAAGLRDQCNAAGVPFFFKQWGDWAPGECAKHPATRTEHVGWWFDNRWDFDCLTPRASENMHRDDAPDVYRFGKKRTGRLLDGRTWDELPSINAI